MLLLFFKMSEKLCFYFYLFEELYKTFLKCLKEFIDKLSAPGFFFEERFLNNRFRFFRHTELLIFSFFICQLWQVVFFKKIVYFIQIANLSVQHYFQNTFYFAGSNDILSFIVVAAHLHFFYFFNQSCQGFINFVKSF